MDDLETDDDFDTEQDTDRCEHRFCAERGVAYDDNGRFLCQECLETWAIEDMARDYADEEIG